LEERKFYFASCVCQDRNAHYVCNIGVFIKVSSPLTVRRETYCTKPMYIVTSEHYKMHDIFTKPS